MEQKRANANGKMSRRAFIVAAGSGATALIFDFVHGSDAAEAKGVPKEVKIVQYSAAGQREDTVMMAVVVKSDAEWQQQLSPVAFEVTRRAATERAYSGAYWNLHDKGLYRCICCDTALFSSDTKFDSGTGWPSFWQPIAKENVHEDLDTSMGMERTEVKCRLCDAHLGHVFDDGPRPTGMRYCMNSLALNFVKYA